VTLRLLRCTALAVSLAFAARAAAPAAMPVGEAAAGRGYAPLAPAADSTRRLVDSLDLHAGGMARFGGSLQGLLSIAGLPPVRGELELSPEALVFRPSNAGGAPDRLTYPLYQERRTPDGVVTRRSAVTLYDLAGTAAAPVYLFHLDGAVFETTAPGALAELADEPAWLDSLGRARLEPGRPLVAPTDTAAIHATIDSLAGGAYADSLYRVFGRPARPIGLVGDRGKSAGRLGEYIGSRDSVSLAPQRMTTPAQLRHSFAHELAHRWQRNAPHALRTLWREVAPIRDSLRYGFGNRSEQQAEALAFAVHFLQATAAPSGQPRSDAELLEAYERLVPGTRVMTEWLLAQPLYAEHPLAHAPIDAPASLAAACPAPSHDRITSPRGPLVAPRCPRQGTE
jgi:hypothetical protein